MLSVQNLGKNFGTHWAVRDFTVDISEGEFVTLLGPSGSGKSTVLRMIAGLEQPTAGSIYIMGTDVTHVVPQQRDIGLVFQSYALFPNLTVRENIAFPLRVRKWAREKIQHRVDEMLALVGLEHRAQFLPHLLSGGERQRVALVRALAFHPPLLLLDEPLSALDAKVRESLRDSLKEVQRRTGVTTLMVTHDQAEALELSDRVVVMNQGQIEQVGTPADIYNEPHTEFTAQFIGNVNTLDVSIIDSTPMTDQRLWVQTCSYKGHTFPWASREEMTVGSQRKLFVRPEAIAIEQRPGEGRLQATIESITLTGSITRLRLTVDGDAWTSHVLSLGSGHLYTAGSTVYVRPVDIRLRQHHTVEL